MTGARESQHDAQMQELNQIAAEAQKAAGDKTKASIGTSLHKLTHMMDRGETLGYVPPEFEADLAACAEVLRDTP
jgi:hypothetical protein